jgi:DNA invertase Pin-like site-specific DNA recombinase
MVYPVGGDGQPSHGSKAKPLLARQPGPAALDSRSSYDISVCLTTERHYDMDGKFVAYYRVSTARQGASGLGLEAQQDAVRTYLNGGTWKLIAEFTEVESGKHSDRPVLAQAMERCRLTGATLLIAKLDRLSRNVHFLSGLMEQGVEFVACDLPKANNLTVHIMSAMAQYEREAISARTKVALGTIKSKLEAGEEYVSRRSGKPLKRLGNPNGLSVSKPELGPVAVREKAKAFAARVLPAIRELQADGAVSLAAVASGLNDRHVLSAAGKPWTPMGVKRVLDRAA